MQRDYCKEYMYPPAPEEPEPPKCDRCQYWIQAKVWRNHDYDVYPFGYCPIGEEYTFDSDTCDDGVDKGL